VTGKTTEKKRLGGAYPGQRRPHHNPYTPTESQFDKLTGQAVVHFKAYGGGNALTLVQQDGTAQPQSGVGSGGSGTQYVQVTLPPGVTAGQEIHVQAPDGSINAIVIPPGFGPGSTFTVEFAKPDEVAPSSKQSDYTPPTFQAEVYNNNINSVNAQFDTTPVAHAEPVNTNANNSTADDGFASGFGKRY
jgi:hypothetical protein